MENIKRVEHSPLPWETTNGTFQQAYRTFIATKSLDQIAEVQGKTQSEAQANAEFIVKCVNSHDALVQACWRALNQKVRTADVANMLREALALAEGE